jgi:hypothetical protein
MKKRIKCTYCHRVHITNKKGLCLDCIKEIEEKQFLEKRIEQNKNRTHFIWIVFEFNWDKKNTKHFLQFSEINHIRKDDKCYIVIYSLNDLLDIESMLNIFCSINNLEPHKIRADISNIGLQNRIEVVEIDKIYKEF